MRMIYLAHPFGGLKENVDKVKKIILGLIHKHPDCTFYSPLHAIGFFYSQLTYLNGMEHCFEVLSRCDELWLTGNWRESRGCKLEFDFATERSMIIKELTYRDWETRKLADRKSTRLNSSHRSLSRMPSSA